MNQIDARLDLAVRGFRVSGPVPRVSIEAAEKTLGLLFPPSYRHFVENYGAALGFGFEIAGLPIEIEAVDAIPMWSNVLQVTLSHRPNSLPEDSIAISHDGNDHGYFLKCSRLDPNYEGPVIEWGPMHHRGKQFADGFIAFLETLRRR